MQLDDNDKVAIQERIEKHKEELLYAEAFGEDYSSHYFGSNSEAKIIEYNGKLFVKMDDYLRNLHNIDSPDGYFDFANAMIELINAKKKRLYDLDQC